MNAIIEVQVVFILNDDPWQAQSDHRVHMHAELQKFRSVLKCSYRALFKTRMLLDRHLTLSPYKINS